MTARTGYLRLIGERKGEKTILKDSYSEGAFKVTRPLYLTPGGEAYLYIMNPGGGYLDGDTYKVDMDLEEDAQAVVTTQSSTKIYKTRTLPAFQEMEINLRKGSVLEYLPDPVIAYQNACYKQRMIVQMEQGASLICTDIFTPGWAPDGTLFRYDLLQSRMEVYLEGRIILFDHLKLEPDKDLKRIGYMEGFTHFGTMIVIHEKVNQELLEELHELLNLCGELRIGFSMLAVPGFALRILGNATQEIEKALSLCHEILRNRLLGKEPIFLRKY